MSCAVPQVTNTNYTLFFIITVRLSGSEFLYTTHGFTLLSAVIEKAGNEAFQVLAKRLFEELGMVNTYLDEYNPIIMNRSRQAKL